jgi:hypothetical protein
LSTAARVLGVGRTLRDAADLGIRRDPAVGYIGWLGYENLGDDVMHLAVAQRLQHARLAPLGTLLASSRLRPVVGRILRRRIVTLLLGGGTQFCNRGWRRELDEITRWLGPLDVLPLGVGVDMGTHQSEEPPVWRDVFARCDRITVRGPRSQRRLADFGFDSEVVGDTALLVDPVDRPEARPGSVGINVGPVTPVPVSDARLVEIAVAVARDAMALGYEPSWIAAIPEDLPLLQDARRRVGSVGPVIEAFRDPLGFATQAARLELVVAAKLHVGVLAALSGVPIVSLAYEQKCVDFAESLDCLDLVVDLVDDDSIVPASLERFHEVAGDLTTWSQRLTDGIAVLRPRLLARFDEVQAAVEHVAGGR